MLNNLLTIPEELKIQVFSNLDGASLIRCGMTCKSIHKILNDSTLLTYILQLYLDGFKDAGTSKSYPDLIESLKCRRQAWLSLDSLNRKGFTTRHMQRDCQSYELVSGAFANTSKDRLEILWLPTLENATGRILQRPSIGISVRDFTMDPTQDLIVLLEDDTALPPALTDSRIIGIHIRTISTNVIHPQAQRSPLQFDLPTECGSYGTSMRGAVLQITYKTLSLSFFNGSQETRVLIWDWNTSELIMDTSISFDPSLRPLKYDFCLLDSTYCFVTCNSNFGSIKLYKIVRSHTVANPPVHVATLHLPPTSPGTMVLGISSHAGPVEANPLSHVPFMLDEEDRLHMFAVVYKHSVVNGNGRTKVSSVNLFVHQRIFTDYARRACAKGLLLDISWDEWGPVKTRLVYPSYKQYASDWIRYIHGQRAIFSAQSTSDVEPDSFVHVLDFSLAAVLSAKNVLPVPTSASKSKPAKQELLSSSTISAEQFPIFADDVETHLPCVLSTLELKKPYEPYMIYADGIIGANMKSNGNFLLHMYTVV